jgi:hypothetical protein
MKLVKNIPRVMWWFKTMHGSILWRHRRSNMKYDAKVFWFECKKRQSKMLFLSCENRVLDDKSDDQNKRKRCIYRGQELATWKDKIALWNRRSAVSFCGQAAELDRRMSPERTGETSAVSFGGSMTADHDRRLRPRELNRPGLNGGFERRLETADRNRGN